MNRAARDGRAMVFGAGVSPATLRQPRLGSAGYPVELTNVVHLVQNRSSGPGEP